MNKKVVIIGGVAGGASVAAKLRRMEKDTEIIVLEKGEFISYANCGLPYYIGGLVEYEQLLVMTPEQMKKKSNIEVRTFNEALKIDRVKKEVLVKNHRTGVEYTESYDKLVIATGASSLKTAVPGVDLPGVFSLWTMADSIAIKTYVNSHRIKNAVIAGGGFVSVELAENLRNLGIHVTVIQSPKQLLKQFDEDIIVPFQEHFVQNGVNLILEDRVKEIQDHKGTLSVLTNKGLSFEAELVVLAVGVKPNSQLAADAGLELGVKGSIVTDEYLRTSDPDIYAAGDVIQVVDFVTKMPTVIPLAGPANRQGRIVADNLAGKSIRYPGTQGSFIIKAFDMTAAATGASEKTLNDLGKTAGKDYAVVKIKSPNHAVYYPRLETLDIKVIFSLPDGKILGAQAVGGVGVDKRIDVLAAIIRYGGKVQDLRTLELAYAPPFSTPKNTLNIIGYESEKYIP